MNKQRFLDVTQVARRLAVSNKTVYRMIQEGKLPASRLGTAHCIRIEEKDLEQYIAERTEVVNYS